MFDKVFTKEDTEIQEGLHLLKEESREKILGYLKAVAQQKNLEKTAANTSLEDLLDGKKKDRIAIVIPESAGDVLICNSLIGNLKKLYPDKDIYFITDPKFFPMINANPDIYKIIPFKAGIDNLLLLEGQGKHTGFFEMAFLPHVGSQRYLNYMHNGKQKHGFELY